MSGAAMLKFKEDDIIVRQGDAEKNLYKVMSGSVALYINYGRDDEYLVGVLSFPKCFGEMSVLTGQLSYYTVVALTEVTVLRVPESNFEAFIKGDYENAMSIMKTMARNLSMVNMNMNLLVEELRELGKKDGNIGRLLDSVNNMQSETLYFTDENNERHEETISNGRVECQSALYPSGHKGYPKVTHPEYKEFTFSKDYICPHCGEKFSGDHIFRSKLIQDNSDKNGKKYDMHILYKDFEMEWYEITTCPHCYFSALAEFFISPKNLSKKQYEERLNNLHTLVKLNFSDERDIDFVFCQHYLALECANGLLDSMQHTARLWYSLACLYKSVGDEEMECYAKEKALEMYKQIYSECDLQPAQDQQLCMRVAGVFYDLGDMHNAKDWAYKARTIKAGRPYISNLAQELIEDIRELCK